MRPIYKTAYFAVLLSAQALAEERVNVNKQTPYENRPAITIEYSAGETALFNEETAIELVAERIFSVADELVIVASAKSGDISNLALADSRLSRLTTLFLRTGIPNSRLTTFIDRVSHTSPYVDIYVVPHTWKGLSSAQIQKHIETSAGTLSVTDTKEGLIANAVGQVLVKDGKLIESLESLKEQIGWTKVISTELSNVKLSVPIKINFPTAPLPLKAEQVSELISKLIANYSELEGVSFKVYPEEKLIHLYKEI